MISLKFFIGLVIGVLFAFVLFGFLTPLKAMMFPEKIPCMSQQETSSLDNLASQIENANIGADTEAYVILDNENCAVVGFSKSKNTGDIDTPSDLFGMLKDDNSFLCLCELKEDGTGCTENKYCKEFKNLNAVGILDAENDFLVAEPDSSLKEIHFTKTEKLFIYNLKAQYNYYDELNYELRESSSKDILEDITLQLSYQELTQRFGEPNFNKEKGNLWVTKYYIACEQDHKTWGSFAKDVKIQGTGFTKNNRLCRYSTVQEGRSSCRQMGEEPVRISSRAQPIAPHRTLAGHPDDYGKTVYLYYSEDSPYNGCYIIEDTGGKNYFRWNGNQLTKPWQSNPKGWKYKKLDLFVGKCKKELKDARVKAPSAYPKIWVVDCQPKELTSWHVS